VAWTTADIPRQDGRTAIVTGANTGLGLETAAALAEAGATVVLACRDTGKAEDARALIDARGGSGRVEILALDLGDLSAIAEAAAETRERFPSVDLLINNAGVMIPPRMTTADGFELQFGTNHLGHFAYTGQVLETLLRTPGSRVVTVSSLAHQQGRMRWDDLDWERSYDRMAAYSQSKLANLLFTFELDRRLTSAGAGTVALAAHPGLSSTDLARYLPGATLPGLKQLAGAVIGLVFNSAADGALATLRAATDPDATGSQFYGPSGPREIRGRPVLVMPRSHAVDEDDRARLWTLSEHRTGVRYPL
jgi:NAD(P)-dependent dehydrogenase (short-subunit alcohol dehydrogenase family)